MGADMHTASLFPGAPELAAALADDAPALVDDPSARPARGAADADRAGLRGASVIHILITGADKLAALETRRSRTGRVAEAPVRVALTAPCPVTVHYAA